jgi:hypothetical protein
VIADKGFDADERVIAPLERAGKRTVIPASTISFWSAPSHVQA